MYFSNFILLQQNGTRVSVIIPKEVIPVMEYLANPLTRKNFGIKGENILFYLPTRVGMLFQFSTMCWYIDLILVIMNNISGLEWCSKNWFSSQTFLHKPKKLYRYIPFFKQLWMLSERPESLKKSVWPQISRESPCDESEETLCHYSWSKLWYYCWVVLF